MSTFKSAAIAAASGLKKMGLHPGESDQERRDRIRREQYTRKLKKRRIRLNVRINRDLHALNTLTHGRGLEKPASDCPRDPVLDDLASGIQDMVAEDETLRGQLRALKRDS